MELKIHVLKTWPEYFERVVDDSKKFEIRKNDRGFKKGDILRLREWTPDVHRTGTGEYTGREVTVVVTYVTTLEHFSGSKDYVVLSIKKFKEVEKDILVHRLRIAVEFLKNELKKLKGGK